MHHSTAQAQHAVLLGRSNLRPSTPIVGNELCRESYARSPKTPVDTPPPEGNICDKRSASRHPLTWGGCLAELTVRVTMLAGPLSQIAADYPYIDWSLVDSRPTDVLYSQGGETLESFAERGYRFMLWLAARCADFWTPSSAASRSADFCLAAAGRRRRWRWRATLASS